MILTLISIVEYTFGKVKTDAKRTVLALNFAINEKSTIFVQF